MAFEGKILPIVIHGDPVLHNRAAEVEEIDDDVRQLVADIARHPGCPWGWAGCTPGGCWLADFTWAFEHTGVPHSGGSHQPVLTLLGKVSQKTGSRDRDRGCLSVPGLGYPLKRSDHVRLQGFDVDGNEIDFEAHGWFARILQHEFDHLNATLYVNG